MEPEIEQVSAVEYSGSTDSQGRWDGPGRVVYQSGAIYEGDWSHGCMHGQGKLVFPDGVVYEGSFQMNTIAGQGTYNWPSGATYTGEVLGGKRHGYGNMSFAGSCVVYEGEWQAGARQGRGALFTNKERTTYYKGAWYQDMKHGVGIMQYANGDVYEGDWAHDVKAGQGSMSWKSSQQQYTGEWRDNAPHGIGSHVWYAQNNTDQSIPSHAQLLMYNRYKGHFQAGQRHGYGVLYYATGSRYEGHWAHDLKEGPGCFSFENGDVWVGEFLTDRPVLGPGETFGPVAVGVRLHIEDLLAEEESEVASGRAVANMLMTANSDLRMLYDKYCKRPSVHLAAQTAQLSSTMTSAQFWELLGDCRLVSLQLNLQAVSQILAQARRAHPDLRAFRDREQQQAQASSLSEEQESFWISMLQEHVSGGLYSPTAEVNFRTFCEALVRVAAAAYCQLPSLEARLHTVLQSHVLHLVSRAKPTAAPLPPPAPALPAEVTYEAAMAGVQEVRPALVAAFMAAAGRGGCHVEAAEKVVYSAEAQARDVTAAILAGGPLGRDGLVSMHQVLSCLCFNYLGRNSYSSSQRLQFDEGSDGVAVEPTLPVVPPADGGDDAGELLQLLDLPLAFPEFVEGVLRLAAAFTPGSEGLQGRMARVVAAV